MKKVLKSRLTAGILVLVVVCLGIVLAGDVVVKEGTLDVVDINATGDVSGATITRNGTEINAGYLAIDGSNATGDIDIGGGGFTANYIEAVGGFISNGLYLNTSSITDSTGEISFGNENLTTTGTVTWSGGGSANANTAYTHSQDNSQAHSDYLINNGDDFMLGTLVALYGLETAGHVLASGSGTFGSIATTGIVTWSGGGSANANTAYTHSQDNSQAHSDYLINNGDDYTSGSIVASGILVSLSGLETAGHVEAMGKGTFGSLKLPVKSTTGDPASPFEGQIYVNTADNKVRVYADGAWRDLATW